MALHLLSSYGSDDESDCDDEPTSTSVGRADDPSPAAVASQQRSGLLEADESCSSSSDSETESEAADSPVKQAPPEREEAAPPAAKRRLPSAAEAFSTTMKTTVLVNEYERAAMEHEAMLSRHVPLTDPKKTKPVCKAFRRGMCRRGKNCRYEHPPEEAPKPDMSKAVSSAPVQYTTASDVFKARLPSSVR